MTVENRIVWAELPAADMERAKAFYAALFGAPLIMSTAGPDTIAVFPYEQTGGRSGHVYEGKPAPEGTGPTVHLAVECKLDEAMTRIRDSGGKTVSEIITIPAGSFFYALDTEGNSIGIFEA